MKIVFVIHDVNTSGGQERSTLEIINRCSQNHSITVLASSCVGLNSNVKYYKIPVFLRRPLFIKDFIFRIFSTLYLLFIKADLIHATGSCTLMADIITVQFGQKRWALEKKKMPKNENLFLRIKEYLQLQYDLCAEFMVYKLLKSKQFVTLCEGDAEDLKKFYGVKKVSVIPHGVNLEEFGPNPQARAQVRQKLKIQEDEILLLFVGTFDRKGLFYLLNILPKLIYDFKIKLCVIGKGDFARANRAVRNLKIENHVLFLGSQNPVNIYYQAADLFLLPSAYDPFGLVGIEALASGLPSLISQQSAVSQFILPGKNGFIVDNPHSSSELLAKLKMLLEMKSNFQQMRIEAFKAVKHQSWNEVWPKYEQIFLSVGKYL